MEGCVLFKAFHSLRINHFVVVAVSVKLSCVRNIYIIMIFLSRSVDFFLQIYLKPLKTQLVQVLFFL